MKGKDLEEYEYVFLTEKSSQITALSEVVDANEIGGKWDPAYNTEEALALVPLRGHILTAKEPNEYSNPDYASWGEEGIFIFPDEYELKPAKGAETLLSTAVAHLKKAKKIIIAADYDNEGATLAMNVIKYAGVEDRVERMLEMGSLHPVELRKAIDNPVDIPYERMFAAGSTRAFIDWSEGMSYSRALSYFLGNKYAVRLNFGGVLTPIIYIVIERELAFDKHEVSYYWHVGGKLNVDGQSFPFKLKHQVENDDGKLVFSETFDSENEAFDAISKLENIDIKIDNIKRNLKKTPPPLLFEFSSLKSHMGSLKKFSPNVTGEAAQKLYDELKLETYARTDVPYLKEGEFEDVPIILKKLGETGVIDRNLIDTILSKDIPFRRVKGSSKSGTFNNKEVLAHGAIVPTLSGDVDKLYSGLSVVDKAVFLEVAKRYTSNFMPDYEYELVSGNTETIDGLCLFFSEKIPKKAGWEALYDKDIDKKISSYVPEIPLDLKKDDVAKILNPNSRRIETKPKPLFTRLTLESDIAKISKLYPDNEDIKKYLGDVGIGTVATRTDIIDRAMAPDKGGREAWIIEVKGKLRGSKTAKKLISILYPELVSPVKRALLSKKLKQIEQGEISSKEVLSEMKVEIKNNIEKIKSIFEEKGAIAVGLFGGDAEVLGKCPLCKKGDIIEKKKIFSCSEAKYVKFKNDQGEDSVRNDGCKYMIRKAGLEKLGKNNITKTEVKRLLSTGAVTVSLKSKRTGKSYNGKMIVDLQWGSSIDFNSGK